MTRSHPGILYIDPYASSESGDFMNSPSGGDVFSRSHDH